MKKTPTVPAAIVWPRSDPAELARFDPASKRCTMNCGQGAGDPRSKAECMVQCGDCEILTSWTVAQP